MKHYLWSQVGVMNEVLTGKFCTCLGCGSALALNALLSSWISFISIKEKTQLTCAVRFNTTKSSRDMAKPQPFHQTNYTGQIKFMTTVVWRLSQLSLYEWVWINQHVLLSIGFRWIECWSCHETWEIFNK